MSDQEKPATYAEPDMATLLASSVHDMKNSVSMLIGGLQKVLASVSPESFPGHADLAHMTYEARRINNNLVQLLTLYKVGQQIYPFDPKEIWVEEFLHGIAEQSSGMLKSQNVTLEVAADSDLYWYFDEDLITGVIGNAFTNAVRYTKARTRLSARVDNGALEIRIEDDGCGYSAEMLAQGREPLRTVDFTTGSTGLGLYFSAVVARMHRNRGQSGEMRLENGGDLGGGCFVLRLP